MNKADIMTVQEYAKIRGCSKQAVYKRLKTTLKPYVVTIEGRQYIAKSALIEDEQDNLKPLKTVDQQTESTKNEQPFNTEIVRILQKQIDILDRQITAKDETIKQQNEVIKQQADTITKQSDNINNLTILHGRDQAELAELRQQLLPQAQDEDGPGPAPAEPIKTEQKKTFAEKWHDFWN